ncbi:hypothetical protein Tco_0708344, partial [Tanacetum coccineum]
MRRQNKGFSGTVTPLYATMLILPQAMEGEGSGQPSEPQHTPSTAQPSTEEIIYAAASSHQPQKTQKHRKAKRGRDTEIPQSGGPPEKVGDEAIYEEWDDGVERAATTAASLYVEQETGAGGSPRCHATMGDSPAQTRSERVPIPSYDSPLLGVIILGSDEERLEHYELTKNVQPTPHDLPLPRVNTLGSDEGSMTQQELMVLCTTLSKKVENLEIDLKQTKQ